MYTAPGILICVVIKHLLGHQRRMVELRESLKMDTVLHIESWLSVWCSSSVKTIEQLSDLFLGLDGIFKLTASELKLVTEVWQSSTSDDIFQ